MLNYGQIVELDGEKAKVVRIWLDFLHRRMATVEFFDRDLSDYTDLEAAIERKDSLSNTKEIDKKVHRNRFYNTDVVCPECGTQWTKTCFGRNTWFDCLKCNKKKEDLL